MFDPLQIPHVFRARSVQSTSRQVFPTGFVELDAALAGGWPHPALIELLVDVYGIGELQLVLPLLRALTSRGDSSLIVWLNPPYVPNGVALEQRRVSATHWLARDLNERDVLWAAEQALRSNAGAAVLVWSAAPTLAALRRLKLAVASTGNVAIVYRGLRDVSQASPASLRVALRPEADRLRVEVIKHEGRKPATLLLDVRASSQWTGAS